MPKAEGVPSPGHGVPTSPLSRYAGAPPEGERLYPQGSSGSAECYAGWRRRSVMFHVKQFRRYGGETQWPGCGVVRRQARGRECGDGDL